jgi:hypothetical protein
VPAHIQSRSCLAELGGIAEEAAEKLDLPRKANAGAEARVKINELSQR